MKRKFLFLAVLATLTTLLFSCKKKSSNPTTEQLQEQAKNTLENASTAERARVLLYKEYKGKVKTVLQYDSLPSEKRFTAYNQSGYVTVDSFYTYNNSWELTKLENYVYDNNNFVVTKTSKQFNNGLLDSGDSTLSTIDNREIVIEEAWQWNNTNSQWNRDEKHRYTFAGKGKIATDTFFTFDANTQQWIARRVDENKYENGNITSTTQNSITAAITPNTRTTIEYDAQGNLKTIRGWEFDNNQWTVLSARYFLITYY